MQQTWVALAESWMSTLAANSVVALLQTHSSLISDSPPSSIYTHSHNTIQLIFCFCKVATKKLEELHIDEQQLEPSLRERVSFMMDGLDTHDRFNEEMPWEAFVITLSITSFESMILF